MLARDSDLRHCALFTDDHRIDVIDEPVPKAPYTTAYRPIFDAATSTQSCAN
jgi:hypothetical protein